MSDDLVKTFYQAVLDGDQQASVATARRWVDAGFDPVKLLNEGGTPAIREVGDRFGRFEVFLPELMLSANALKAALEILLAAMRKEGSVMESEGKVLIGTVEGDIHDIGKNLVAALLATNGFRVIDLGVNVSAKDFALKARTEGADIIALSALMTTSSFFQQQVIDFLMETGERDNFFVIVGGGPVTEAWAKEIGADGYGRTAADAVKVCLSLMKARKQEDLPKQVFIS